VKHNNKARDMGDRSMMGDIIFLVVGFGLGYGVREIVSRRRRAADRRRHGREH
jgi:hypothetical protein